MSLYSLPNPIINANILLKMYKEMNDAEYQTALRDTLTRGAKFIALGDNPFPNPLSEEDSAHYSSTRKIFIDAFKELEKNKSIRNPTYLARTVAWWQCVTALHTLHGKPLQL